MARNIRRQSNIKSVQHVSVGNTTGSTTITISEVNLEKTQLYGNTRSGTGDWGHSNTSGRLSNSTTIQTQANGYPNIGNGTSYYNVVEYED